MRKEANQERPARLIATGDVRISWILLAHSVLACQRYPSLLSEQDLRKAGLGVEGGRYHVDEWDEWALDVDLEITIGGISLFEDISEESKHNGIYAVQPMPAWFYLLLEGLLVCASQRAYRLEFPDDPYRWEWSLEARDLVLIINSGKLFRTAFESMRQECLRNAEVFLRQVNELNRRIGENVHLRKLENLMKSVRELR